MGKFVGGMAAGFLLCPVIVLGYFTLGFAPASTTASPMPFERLIANTALSSRISRDAPSHEPATFTTADLLDGASVYEKNCAVCHGEPREPSTVGRFMYPQAPQLLTPEEMDNHAPDVIYWKVDNGIRLTGMPSFSSLLSDKEKWNVSALLCRAGSLPSEVQDALTSQSVTSSRDSTTVNKSLAGRKSHSK